jgi:hypothetical protein
MNLKMLVQLVLGLSLLVTLGACGPKNNSASVCVPPSSNPSNKLHFESGVPCNQAAALNEAVSSLVTLPLDSSNSSVGLMARTMKTDDVTPAGLQNWMEDRVQYIINGDFKIRSHLYTTNQPFSYSEPNILPDAYTNSASVQGAQIIMLNVGTEVYANGKLAKQLYIVDLPGIGYVPMPSPRTGMLAIGPGLFNSLGGAQSAVVLNIFRLGTLFHEARHSDGHGKTLGFMHSVCPPGHDYAGLPACDLSTNGPYTIGAMMVKNLTNACTNCTAGDLLSLRAMYLDVANRVLDPAKAPIGLAPDASAGMDWDDSPEGSR